jgi:hypothetical protein
MMKVFVGLALLLLAWCCGATCDYELLNGEEEHLGARHRVIADLLTVPQLRCSPKDGTWQWRLDGSGFHRHVVVTVANCSACHGRKVLVLLGLPCGVFVDPFETSGWVAVPGEMPVDLEARADSSAAQPQLVAFQGTADEPIAIPVHFRYPALAVDDALEAVVEIGCTPSVWIERLCELSPSGQSVASLSARIPCGRTRDVWWVVAVTVATAALGCVVLLLRLLPAPKAKRA